MAGKLKRSAVFLAGSILAGLVLAVLAALVWPQLIRPQPAAVPVAEVPSVQSTPVAVATSAPATPPAADVPMTPLERATGGSFADAVRASAPAVVNVYAQRTVTERVPAVGIEQLLGGPLQ